jgi:hypothetical protein
MSLAPCRKSWTKFADPFSIKEDDASEGDVVMLMKSSQLFLCAMICVISIGSMAGRGMIQDSFLSQKQQKPQHLPIEVSSQVYQNLLKQQAMNSFLSSPFSMSQNAEISGVDLSKVLTAGQRNLQWLQVINQNRPAKDRLSFTVMGQPKTFPVEQSLTYNALILIRRFQKALEQAPAEFKSVLVDGQAMSANPSMDLSEYIQWGTEFDKTYQLAARWTLNAPYLSYFAGQKYMDIRGYYFLSHLPNRQQVLQNFSTLDSTQQQQIFSWLSGMCQNSRQTASTCDENVRRKISQSADLNLYYQQLMAVSANIYDSFFQIQNWLKRQDVRWSSTNPSLMMIPFRETESPSVKTFLINNIEDEWKFNTWRLTLQFDPAAAINVKFVPGTYPHVDALGGNNIFMDGNSSLEDWDTQWTIRHEFGHTLGFPDCYVEFYDSQESVMVYYQLEVGNLMCSRQGKFQQRHYAELQRIYFPSLLQNKEGSSGNGESKQGDNLSWFQNNAVIKK